MRTLLRKLDEHWFAPASLRDLAIARVVVAGTQLFLLLYSTLVGEAGPCPGCSLRYQLWLTEIDPELFLPLPALRLSLLPFGGWEARPDPLFIQAVWVAGVVAGVMAVIGLYTRLSMLVLAGASTLLVAHSYSYEELHHPEAALIIVLWVLALGPSGAALSLDSLRLRLHDVLRARRFSPVQPTEPMSPFARWPLRTAQWLIALVYLSAALSKLVIGGWDWYNGYTLTYYLTQDGIRHGRDVGLFLAGYPALGTILAVLTVSLELAFFLAVLVPGLAWLFVLGGTVMHATIYIVQAAPFLQSVMLYVVFIEPLRRTFRRLVPERSRSPRDRWLVLYDGFCPLCLRSVVLLEALDVRRRLEFADLEREWPEQALAGAGVTRDDARRAMHVIDPDGRIYRGFFAFRAFARLLPPLWITLPLFYAPGASRLGSWIYDHIARNRSRAVCDFETCEV